MSLHHETARHGAHPIELFPRIHRFAAATERLVLRLIAAIGQRRRDRERRDAFKTLLRLDERTLKDIGLARGDVVWASRLPLHANAAAELQKIRNKNKKSQL